MNEHGRDGLDAPLAGVRVIEMASVGPVPFCGMVLERLGADIVIIDRPDDPSRGRSVPRADPLRGHRTGISLDLRSLDGREKLLALIEHADVLVEGMRPGVMERLGVGPDVCAEVNPRLVYGRVSGWGPEGEMARTAGHDINYLAAAGALWLMGDAADPPMPPLNLVGDYGGGGMFLVAEILAALVRRSRTGRGGEVATSIYQATALMMGLFFARALKPGYRPARGTDSLDGSAPHYGAYETKDGKFVAVGAVEDVFFAELLARAGLSAAEFGDRRDPAQWREQSRRMADVFRTKTQQEWVETFAGADCCVTPVYDPLEAIALHDARGPEIYSRSLIRFEPITTAYADTLAHDSPVPGGPAPSIEDQIRAWSDGAATTDTGGSQAP
jgi:alpha-methylacyl-CoA racemase